MQLLRKYTSNRGSALFMVISTMTALMISCMAMYFSVISSRSTQYAIFNQQQSKQSASSINDAMIAGMMDGQLSTLTDAMTKLKEGEKLSAGANGFKELGLATGKENDSDLGAYTVEIMRLPNETVGGVEKMVFDISVTSVVNGSNSVYHTIIYYEQSNSEAPPAPTQVFAATGYVPNDVFLNAGKYMTDLFFDNEMLHLKAYGSNNPLEIYGNLSAGGSVTVHTGYSLAQDRALTFAIRNGYTANFNSTAKFSPTAEKSMVLIGGDAHINAGGAQGGFENANVYILGNLYLRGLPTDNSNYFVDGNVYVEGGYWPSMKNVYCNGVVDVSKNNNCGAMDLNGLQLWSNPKVYTAKTAKSWNDKAGEDILNVSEMITTLDEKTATNTYYKWVINDNNPSGDKYIRELDESRPSTVVKKTLEFSLADAQHALVELKYSPTEKGCIIEDVKVDNKNNLNYITLVIDTGEDEDNTYTIRVKANKDCDGDNVNETFSWYPLDSHQGYLDVNIIVKGRGSVVIDIPKDVTYQDEYGTSFMHYGWFLLGGGKHNGYVYDPAALKVDGIANTMRQFIHTDCKAGDGCVYSEKISANKCSKCGGNMKVISCSIHGDLSEYCPAGNPENGGEHSGLCANRVGRKEIDDYLASHPDIKAKMLDSEGKVIYPNTNIFLVSCEESANIRLSNKVNSKDTLMLNSFYGYIYAPYMTFKAFTYGNAAGSTVRLLGGMTVSDYILEDNNPMIACWPDKMPNDLMSDECKKNAMQGLGGKGWKISLKAH